MASRRQYLTQTELAEFADIVITDTEEADDQIGQAEELIDAYVGFQEKAVSQTIRGEVSSATSLIVYDTGSGTNFDTIDDYFKGCEIEIVTGTGSGQRRTISSSSKSAKSVTVSTAFDTIPDTTSIFRIYQLGKFPRIKDSSTNRAGDKYYRFIPEAVRRAVAAQVQYMIEMGADYFAGNSSNMNAESIGNYSYQSGGTASGQLQAAIIKMVGPKARALLRGIKNSGGRLVSDNPTWQ